MKLDVEEQKVRFVVAAARREKPLNALCEEFGISRPTGYLWWRRYEEAGLAGLSKRSRRPKQSPRRTAAELERRVTQVPSPFVPFWRLGAYSLPRNSSAPPANAMIRAPIQIL